MLRPRASAPSTRSSATTGPASTSCLASSRIRGGRPRAATMLRGSSATRRRGSCSTTRRSPRWTPRASRSCTAEATGTSRTCASTAKWRRCRSRRSERRGGPPFRAAGGRPESPSHRSRAPFSVSFTDSRHCPIAAQRLRGWRIRSFAHARVGTSPLTCSWRPLLAVERAGRETREVIFVFSRFVHVPFSMSFARAAPVACGRAV
mmetsp:Transcript_13928/g.44923  ORF Transcript_13928/g.44923 Transcript_13928/m.44923 type:complete len:205 (-) Transcript_13928:16-630(-)